VPGGHNGKLSNNKLNLQTNVSNGGSVVKMADNCWHLEIPPGPKRQYRLAQLDDYTGLSRNQFSWYPSLRLSLSARVSSPTISGTWGFGLWNDPFSFSLGFGGGTRRFPALPNATWFFFASPHNYLSFKDDKPAWGFLAQTFHSPEYLSFFLALSSIFLPLLVFPRIAKKLRNLLGKIIKEDSYLLSTDPTQWHTYTLESGLARVTFRIDDLTVAETEIGVRGHLGLVIWIDNQFLAFRPDGKLSYGLLENTEPAWLEIKGILR
jgi:hypothetical protein